VPEGTGALDGVSVATGKTIALKVRVRNQGNVPAAGSAILDFVVSTTPSADQAISTASRPAKVSVKAGATGTLKLKVPTDVSIPPGSYYLLIKLTGQGLLATLNETNGGLIATVPLTIT
jgi:uncharacterized membrane protein